MRISPQNDVEVAVRTGPDRRSRAFPRARRPWQRGTGSALSRGSCSPGGWLWRHRQQRRCPLRGRGRQARAATTCSPNWDAIKPKVPPISTKYLAALKIVTTRHGPVVTVEEESDIVWPQKKQQQQTSKSCTRARSPRRRTVAGAGRQSRRAPG